MKVTASRIINYMKWFKAKGTYTKKRALQLAARDYGMSVALTEEIWKRHGGKW